MIRLSSLKRWTLLLAAGATLGAQSADEGTPVAAPLNPAFVAWQRAHVKTGPQALLAPQARTQARSYGRIPPPMDLAHIKGRIFEESAHAWFPRKYDLRALNQVTAVRDQWHWGTCWAHAALASLESSQRKSGHGTFDLSEWHLSWFCYNDYLQDPTLVPYTNTGSVADTFNGGGWDGMAVALLARGTGAVNEKDSPYQYKQPFPEYSIPTGSEPVSVKLQDALFVRSNEDDTSTTLPTVRIQDVKHSVMRYGAVSVGINADDGMAYSTDSDWYNPVTHAFFDPVSTAYDTNHAVNVVGWDDDYPATSFEEGHRPQRNGAWIVRNSWGADWGDAGYFYVSYESKTFDGVAYVYDDKAFNHVYQYDPLGWIESVGFGDTMACFANVFTAKADELVSAVSFYSTDLDSRYQVSIRKGVKGDPSTGRLAARSQSGRLGVPGYRTLVLDQPVAVSRGEKFAVIVKLETAQYSTPIAIEAPLQDYSDRATANAGESYISHTGTAWTDLTKSYPDSSVCLKAFAVPCQRWWGSVLLDGGDAVAKDRAVEASLNGGFASQAPARVCYSWDGCHWSRWQGFGSLLELAAPGANGKKTLYVKYMDEFGRISPIYQDSIVLAAQ